MSSSPALWWPYQFGSPELYQLAMSADSGGTTSDTKAINFGIRQFTDYRTTVNGTSFVGYKVNGQNILIRGGGYVWDLLQRWDTRTNTATVQYVKDMGLNTIRLEGTLGNEELYDLADQAGVMIMPGFVCCSTWESDANWNAEQQQVANASLDSQMRALRAHASPFVWAFGSDQPPNAAHLAMYKSTATALHWQNPTLDNVATWANANAGVKMDGPYKWEPPVLWWDTSKAGSAFGTTAEEGTESPPPLESLQKFIGPGRSVADRFRLELPRRESRRASSTTSPSSPNALNVSLRLGDGRGRLLEQVRASELRERPLVLRGVELARVHASRSARSSGCRTTRGRRSIGASTTTTSSRGGGYFGTKKANEAGPHRLRLRDQKVFVVNSTLTARSSLTATATLYQHSRT